jgi:hypothetical protein
MAWNCTFTIIKLHHYSAVFPAGWVTLHSSSSSSGGRHNSNRNISRSNSSLLDFIVSYRCPHSSLLYSSVSIHFVFVCYYTPLLSVYFASEYRRELRMLILLSCWLPNWRNGLWFIRGRDFPLHNHVQTSLGPTQCLIQCVPGRLSPQQNGQIMKLTTDLQPVSQLRLCGAIPPFLHT